jgi:hypothetical protein
VWYWRTKRRQPYERDSGLAYVKGQFKTTSDFDNLIDFSSTILTLDRGSYAS